MRFLDVTLDTYQNTSGYMYLGLFIEDSPTAATSTSTSTTGYFYQEGFLPSQTEAGEEEDEKEEADDADDANEQPPAKKKKGDN